MEVDETEEKSTKPKSRVSYPKELREEASFNLRGLVTISVKMLDGSTFEHQMSATVDECQFAKWAAVLLGRPDVRPVPDLEELVRKVCEERGISN